MCCNIEKKILSGFLQMYQNKMREDRDQYVVNINKTKFEAYSDLAEQAFLKLNENLINNQDLHS